MVVQPNLGWRWTEYLTGILQCFVLLVAVVFVDESYPPKLLVSKARRPTMSMYYSSEHRTATRLMRRHAARSTGSAAK